MQKELENERSLREKAENRVLEVEKTLADLRREVEKIKEQRQQELLAAEDRQRQLQKLKEEELRRQQQQEQDAELQRQQQERDTELQGLQQQQQQEEEQRRQGLRDKAEQLRQQQQEILSELSALNATGEEVTFIDLEPARTPRPQATAEVLDRVSIPRESSHRRVDQGSVRNDSFVPFMATKDMLPEYSGTDKVQPVEKWLEQVSEEAYIAGWNDYETLVAAKKALKGTAKRWLDSQRGITSWQELKQRLQRNFGRRIDPGEIYEALRSRKKKKEESIFEYFHEMEYLAAQGGISEREVAKYIIRGAVDDVNVRTLISPHTPRGELMQILEAREREFQLRASKKQFRNYGQDQAHHIGGGKRCYGCGSEDHLIGSCILHQQQAPMDSSEDKKKTSKDDRIGIECLDA